MIERPLVSICVPTYNAAGTVRDTLRSILGQTYPNFVVHISDNASTDDTIKVIEALADPRIIVHRNETNIGGEGNFNRCIQLSEGKYTAIFHADDIYEPEMVEKQVAFLESHPEAGAVFTEALLIDGVGKRLGVVKLPQELTSPNDLFAFKQLFKVVLHRNNFFMCPSAMVRTRIYKEEIKEWRYKQFKSSSDLDVWLRIAQRHFVGFLRQPLMRYRVSQQQFSAGVRSQVERADFLLVLEHYLARDDVRRSLSNVDYMHYRWLERTDRVRRAVNLFMRNQVYEAKLLCRDVISLDTLRQGADGRRGFLTLTAGLYIRLFVFFHLPTLGRTIINIVKRKIP